MRAALLIISATGCASSYQSARTLVPGKTQVTTALTRIQEIEDNNNDTVWGGDIQVRHGLADKVDGGVRLGRNPGAGENLSYLALDGKFQLTPVEGTTTLSLALPIGLLWAEDGSDFQDGAIIVAPGIFLGIDLSPLSELVFAPRFMLVFPDASNDDSQIEYGASIGLRLFDATRSWAVQPEVSLMSVGERDRTTLVTLGIGIAAGN